MHAYFIRAILFDLGGTLMYAKDPWLPVLARADRALADSLYAQGLQLDCDGFHEEFRSRLRKYYDARDADLFETTTTSVLRSLLDEKGYQDVSEKVIRFALDARYTVTQSNWLLEDDAISTLEILQNTGHRLGIISNAGDNKDVFQLVDKFGIEPYFDFILTSAACSYRKPHVRIFELALAHWGMPPREAAMVGDSLEADIKGANQAGIYSIWITRRVDEAIIKIDIQPSTTISALHELPGLLSGL